MRAINFPDWQDVLECDMALQESDRNSYKITIRWFLSYCRRVRRPASKEQAYAFMEEACERKQPTDWVAKRWKDGINWFFSHAPKEAVDGADQRSGQECPRSDLAGGREQVKKLAGAEEANPASGNARAASGEQAHFEEADREICVPG
ncbi:MAG TPA: hypothetical protein VJ952_03535, partial [Opitutales bacterium]|nr:hypothetical protein [Opitutales bacterium]